MPKPKGSKDPTVVEVCDPSSLPGRLKAVGGSRSDTWNNVIAHQTMQALWVKHSNEEQRKDQANAALSGLIGINPNDELEGMLAAQLVSCHNASMECYRRAMLSEQTFEGRRDNLNQANKLSRTYATLLEALNPAPWQRAAERYGRTRPRSQWRPSHRRQCGGRDADQIGGSTPCTWICTGPRDAEHKHGAGSPVSRPR
jgi:hypothetical protein